jgi:hypothetical protein
MARGDLVIVEAGGGAGEVAGKLALLLDDETTIARRGGEIAVQFFEHTTTPDMGLGDGYNPDLAGRSIVRATRTRPTWYVSEISPPDSRHGTGRDKARVRRGDRIIYQRGDNRYVLATVVRVNPYLSTSSMNFGNDDEFWWYDRPSSPSPYSHWSDGTTGGVGVIDPETGERMIPLSHIREVALRHARQAGGGSYSAQVEDILSLLDGSRPEIEYDVTVRVKLQRRRGTGPARFTLRSAGAPNDYLHVTNQDRDWGWVDATIRSTQEVSPS